MTSHQASSSTSAPSAAHSYLLGSLQQPATPVTPSKARKQAQVQRTRLVALSKHLMTRLQYANFKVEHGWTKQSLSEVENLYYRQKEGGPASTAARKSTSTSPNGPAANRSATAPATASNPSLGSRLFTDNATSKRAELEDGDVFGGYGLATPPISGGTVPGAQTASMAQNRARSASPSTTAQSETRTTKRSPNSGTTLRSVQHKASMPVMQSSNGVTSYADFWSRVGGANTGPVSPNKKRSADNIDSAEIGDNALPTENAGGAVVSPKKRVRVDDAADHGKMEASAKQSPVKAALIERGPSFASSGRR